MSTITRRRPLGRSVATLAATAMIGSGLAALAVAPAHADAPGTTLRWGVSQYLNEHLLGQTFTDGASEDANGIVTFTGGVGRTDTRTHETNVQYEGTARYAFLNPSSGAELYSVAFTDPEVTVDASGAGEVHADVAWTAPGNSGDAQDVQLTTFTSTGASWNGYLLTATPDWTGIAPDEGYPASNPANPNVHPVDGASWSPELIGTLPATVTASFYASGSNPTSDAKKFPAVVAATVPGPSITPTVTSADATGITIAVAGTGFTAKTNSSDDGVYVGLAPSGGLPDVSSPANQSAFITAAWVGGAIPPAIVDGAFSTTLNAGADKLVAGKAYSVYTWQAHSHSNTTQDTETPVAIDWAAVGATTVKPVVTAPVRSYGQAGQVTVRVPGANGTVTLTGLGAARTATLSGGVATFPVPATTAPRSYALQASYNGEFLHFPSASSATLTVAKATPRLAVTWAKKPAKAKKSVLVVKVAGPAGVAVPAGTVKAQLKKGKKKVVVKAVALKNGQVRLVITKKQAKKLAKGKWTVTVGYSGNASFNAVTATSKVQVKKK